MHAQSTAALAESSARAIADVVLSALARTCNFGICRHPAARVVVTPTAIGRRLELLCDEHAQRRHELDQVLVDEPLLSGSAATGQSCERRDRRHQPIPFVVTDAGRAALAEAS